MVTKDIYEVIVNFCGHRPYEPQGDNWFVVLNHRTKKYECFTVNDGYEAPERYYMNRVNAFHVRDTLNLMKETDGTS